MPVEGELRERRERGWGGSGTSSLELTRGGLTCDLAHTVPGLGLENGVTELRVRVRVDGHQALGQKAAVTLSSRSGSGWMNKNRSG